MQAIAKMLRASKVKAIEYRDETVSQEFTLRFGLSDGDYIEVDRGCGVGFVPCRIMLVEYCFYNKKGGYTAYVRLATLTRDGRISTTRGLILCVDKNRKLHALEPQQVRRIRKEYF